MENKTEKHLKALAKKVFSKAEIETPSLDFTSKVMYKVVYANEKKQVYKPLIPRVIWVLILFTLVFWFFYLLKHHFVGSSNWIPSIDLSALFSNFKLPKTVFYTLILFAFMVCIQIPLLKYYFDKRLKA